MSYKLVIADDEAIERCALKLMVSKNMPEFEVIGEAENGREAVQLVHALRPDIVLMDIKMPGMDGLTALSEIRKFDEQVRFIVLSAHNDFEYAQHALKLGADDYLLKPARFNKLAETLWESAHKLDILRLSIKQAHKMQDKINSLRPDLESRIIASVAAGMSTSVMLNPYACFLDIELQNCLCIVVRLSNQLSSEEEQRRFLTTLKEEINSISNCCLADFAFESLVILVPIDATWDDTRIIQWGAELSAFVKHILKSMRIQHTGIGVSSTTQNAGLLHMAYQQAAQSALQSSAQSTKVVDHDEIYKKELKLFEKVALGDLDQSRLLLDDLFSAYSISNPENLLAIKSRIRELIIVLRRKLIHELKQYDSVNPMVEAKLAHLEELCTQAELYQLISTYVTQCVALCQKSGSGSGRILESALSYIAKNYTKSFSLDDVARALGVSAPYLSRLFKFRLGKNFIDYITGIRIDFAKELLSKHDMSIKEITYIVGYNSQAYFCKVFRKVTGMSASQYQNRI